MIATAKSNPYHKPVRALNILSVHNTSVE